MAWIRCDGGGLAAVIDNTPLGDGVALLADSAAAVASSGL